MGTWGAGIYSNDTAEDLKSEYLAVFYKYDVEEALKRIDEYVRREMFDESDEEEWCNYYYSLADFMWKKGILTDEVRDRAIEMIDSGFGLELWAMEGEKTLNARKKKLQELREKLMSPQGPKKKIKPDAYTQRIFEDGDIIAVQLNTAGKTYKMNDLKPMTQEEFLAMDKKYVLMQLVTCKASWSSSIAPEVKDYWAYFRLFDGIYDEITEDIDYDVLTDASILEWPLSSLFYCGCSMVYFRRRKYKLLCNRRDLIENKTFLYGDHIFLGGDYPDSILVSAMDKKVVCSEFSGTRSDLERIVYYSNRYGRYGYSVSQDENEKRFKEEYGVISEKIDNTVLSGGRLLGISFGKPIGIVTVQDKCIDNLYIEGRFQRCGHGKRLLEYAFLVAGEDAYIDVPRDNEDLRHVCNLIGLRETPYRNSKFIRMKK